MDPGLVPLALALDAERRGARVQQHREAGLWRVRDPPGPLDPPGYLGGWWSESFTCHLRGL